MPMYSKSNHIVITGFFIYVFLQRAEMLMHLRENK